MSEQDAATRIKYEATAAIGKLRDELADAQFLTEKQRNLLKHKVRVRPRRGATHPPPLARSQSQSAAPTLQDGELSAMRVRVGSLLDSVGAAPAGGSPPPTIRHRPATQRGGEAAGDATSVAESDFVTTELMDVIAQLQGEVRLASLYWLLAVAGLPPLPPTHPPRTPAAAGKDTRGGAARGGECGGSAGGRGCARRRDPAAG